jgi:uncharacterized membrane protein YdjX (TVP38/TMEM64 family)
LFAAMTLLFVLAERAGWEQEAWWSSRLEPWRAGWGAVGGFVAISAALTVDLVLPVPSSVVMTLAGAWLGPWAGTGANVLGGMAGSWLGWLSCRLGGRPMLAWLVGEEQAALEQEFQRWGPWVLVLGRGVPMVAEVASCLAGAQGMGFWRFSLLSLLGLLPIAATYAVAGAAGLQAPWVAVIVAFVLPGIAYALIRMRG